MNKYNFTLNLNSDNSLTRIIRMVHPNARILEFGCAYGRLTKYLYENMNCQVDIVEIDLEAGKVASQYSKHSCIGTKYGDLEQIFWFEKLKCEKYDFIIFADILEHLKSPEKVLILCQQLLKDEGSIIISVPNLAHNSIIFSLLSNKFFYNETGLLDSTHIHFFTYHSLKDMIEKCGYKTVIEECICKKDTEIPVVYNQFSKSIKRNLCKRELAYAYQFIFKIDKISNNTQNSRNIYLDKIYDYELVCYFKTGVDVSFSENKTYHIKFEPRDINAFVIPLEQYDGLKEIRIDPINTNCIIKIKNIYLYYEDECIEIDIDNTNGEKDSELYYFTTDDPQIYIKLEQNIHYKRLEFEIDFLIYDDENIAKLKSSMISNNRYLENTLHMLQQKEKEISDLKQEFTCSMNKYEELISELSQKILELEESITTEKNILNNYKLNQNKHLIYRILEKIYKI